MVGISVVRASDAARHSYGGTLIFLNLLAQAFKNIIWSSFNAVVEY